MQKSNLQYDLMLGDCLVKLKEISDNSIDSIVTDPPYGISFMNERWDYEIPSVSVWKECLRVLKPGGHLLSFGGSRTYHRIAINIEDSGFSIRDTLMWLYGTGFPKSHNIGKALDKKGINNDLHYLGTALKPAYEPIIMARKPFKSDVASNVLEYGTGALNIDACRVETDDKYSYPNGPKGNSFSIGKKPDNKRNEAVESNPLGRWPANVLHDGFEEEWFRYFYCPKANKKDRNEENNHPTVKPTELMRYLCRLVTPKNGKILDPYMGSGSTGKAALLDDFSFVGIEMDEEYFTIAKKRIDEV